MKYWEREKAVLELLREKGAVSMTEVCSKTGASVATIRRDFDEIQKKGLAVRTHGGLQLPEKQRKNYINGTQIKDEIDKEKLMIAKEAASQVKAGESIFIGAGKTCNMLAAMLRDVERLSDCRKRMNRSPIGCCALAGTTYATDRLYEAKKLGKDRFVLYEPHMKGKSNEA